MNEESKIDPDIVDIDVLTRHLCWDKCSELFVDIRNGKTELIKELEDISKNGDLICLGYLAILMNRCSEFNDKYTQLRQQISEIITNLQSTINSTSSSSSFEDYLLNLTNYHEQFIFSVFFEQAIGVEKNPIMAFKLCKLAADQNFPLAQCLTGYYYGEGFGIDKNNELSFQYTLKSAENGYSIAQCNVGLDYDDGIGVTKDLQEAFKWYQKSAEQGYIDAQNKLGICYRYSIGVHKNYILGFEWLMKTALRGNAFGQFNIGWCYYFGEGVDINIEEGLNWYRKAIAQNSHFAQYFMGEHLLLETDELKRKEGYDFIRQSANNGFSLAQTFLGMQYFNGENEIMNEEEGIKWIKKAADQISERSSIIIGLCYHYGYIFPCDRNKSKKYFKKAAALDSNTARHYLILGGLQQLHKLNQQNEQNNELFQQIKDYLFTMKENLYTPDSEIMHTIAVCYEYGIIFEKDFKEAFRFYTKSRNYGYSPARYSLGRCYLEGIGTNVDFQESSVLFEFAGNLGDYDAKNSCKMIPEDVIKMRFRTILTEKGEKITKIMSFIE